MASLAKLIARLHSDRRVRGFQFEHLVQWYLKNDPIYRLELKKVWLWNDWPDTWGRDAGIDLIAETFDGKLWAIQTKAYSTNYAIKKSDVDTFLSESSREIFSYRLLIATTNLIGNTAKRTLEQQEKPVGLRLLYDLEKSAVSWPESLDDLRGQPAQLKKPLPHQEQAISQVCQGFDSHERGQLLMACGTGKTLVALWIAEKLQGGRTLVLSPSLSILAYTLREWTANASEPFHYLAVCSDETVQNTDEWTSGTVELGLPVTTKPEDIANFLRRPERIVVFSTYQSSPAVAEALQQAGNIQFDLAVSDEAHRCAGPEAGPFATILNSNAIGAQFRLFMTGTPRYFSGHVRRSLGMNDYEIASMDDEQKFGPVFHRLSFSEAIKQDLLSDYQVAIVAVDQPTYREYAEQGRFVTTDSGDATDARTLATHIALAKAMKDYDLSRIVSFHSRVNGARRFSRDLPGFISWMPVKDRPLGRIWADYVSGEMPSGKRDAKLKKLRDLGQSERGLVANARCLVEGVDLPELDAVAFVDPRASQVDIVQAVGRAIRKSDDKKVATIVLPVFIDSVEDSEHMLSKSAFKPVWDVLKALRSHDDTLAEALDQLRRNSGEFKGQATLPTKIVCNFPVTIDASFAHAFSVTLVDQSTASWEYWLGLLRRFVNENGHAIVPARYKTEDGKGLGHWVIMQRSRKSRLSIERQHALEALPDWTWDVRESAWNAMFSLLEQYVDQNGHASVPHNYKTEDGKRLGNWVIELRSCKEQLSEDRQLALEALPGWTWDVFESAWNAMFGLLEQYVDQHGHARIPSNYKTEDGEKLGLWVTTQRSHKDRLSTDRQLALETLPDWTWDVRESAWNAMFSLLEQYVHQHGGARVPSNYKTEDGEKLGLWVSVQRSMQEKLSIEQRQALESLARWTWDVRESAWNAMFSLLEQYVHQHGGARVPSNYKTEDGKRLGNWVIELRSCKEQLSEDRQLALEALPGWTWNSRESTWESMFSLLEQYVDQHGHASVPHNYKTGDGKRLGGWVTEQRSQKDRLSIERQHALERLVGWTWNARESKWGIGFSHLQDYVASKGHATVPRRCRTEDGFDLGTWVAEQRQAYRRGELSGERQQDLQSVPTWTWKVRN